MAVRIPTPSESAPPMTVRTLTGPEVKPTPSSLGVGLAAQFHPTSDANGGLSSSAHKTTLHNQLSIWDLDFLPTDFGLPAVI